MPMTPIQYMIGINCVDCGKPASHYYGFFPLCCQCHGGHILSEKETYEIHSNWPIDPHYFHLNQMLSWMN